MMLDMKRTFDEVVEAHADPERAAAILANPFYQALSSSFAGTQEYMAMEKLGQLRARSDAEGTWDLIVVDTPPSRSALDFLDAPGQLARFLDHRVYRMMTGAGSAWSKAVGRAGIAVLRLAGRLVGASVMDDAVAFFVAFDGMEAGFRARSQQVRTLLASPATSFVVVTSPQSDTVTEAEFFLRRLAAEGLTVGAVVANRSTPRFTTLTTTALAALAAFILLPESLTAERRSGALARHTGLKAGEVLRAKPMIWALIVLTLLVIGSAAMMETTLAFFAHDEFGWGPSDVGLSFGAVGLISALLQGGAAAPLARRFGSGPMAVAGVAFHAAGLALLAASASATAMMIGLAIMAIGLGLFNPAFQTLTSDQTNDGDRGLVMGLTQGASSFGRVIGPAVSGTIYAGIGHRAPFAIGALIMGLAIWVALLVARSPRPVAAGRHRA